MMENVTYCDKHVSSRKCIFFCSEDGCKFWYWEEDYIDLLITGNLIDVGGLIVRTVARDETRCEATSNSLKSK